jgi:hypothetical protein
VSRVVDLRALPELSLPLEDLDLDGGPYCMSVGEANDALRRSMDRVGLVNPPLVCRDPRGGWDVVTGFRRLRGLRFLGRERVPCRDLSGAAGSPLDILLLALHENLATRPLNEVEKAMVLSRLSAFVDRDTLRKEFMPLLGLRRRDDLLGAYLVLEKAEPAVRAAVAAGSLSMQSFQALRPWRVDDRGVTVQCIQTLKLNSNKQSVLIDTIEDLMGIEGRGAGEVLGSEALRALLEQGRNNPPQAASRLLEHLRRRRFPALTEAEQRFRSRVARLDLPSSVRVVSPPGFEGPLFRLEIGFRSGGELRETLVRLGRTPGIESLGPPWEEGA